MAAVIGARDRMGRATLASVAIHVLVAMTIPALAWTASTATPVETVSFTRILHIQLTPPRAPKPPPRATAPQHAHTTSIHPASPLHLVASVHRHASPEPRLSTESPGAPVVGSVQRAGAGTANSDAPPDVTPSPAARAVASIGDRRPGGYLPFGAEQPDPVLDPGVRKQLDALGAHVTLLVTVGEDGRTESVDFDPPVDAQLESRIRALLADASWDPAVCGGGVTCEAHATIKL